MWAFEDLDLRPDHALLSPAKWRDVLSEAGLRVQIGFPRAESITQDATSDHCLIIAQKAPATSEALQRLDESAPACFSAIAGENIAERQGFDGIFYLRSESSKPSHEDEDIDGWRAVAQSAYRDLDEMRAFVERSAAGFCCILSPDPKANVSSQASIGARAADHFVSWTSGLTDARWINLKWDWPLHQSKSDAGSAELLAHVLSNQACAAFAVDMGAESSGVYDTRSASDPKLGSAFNQRPALRTLFVAPTGELQISVAKEWEDIFGIEGIGVHDSFFDLGGESLLATQLNSRIRDKFGLSLPLKDFFTEPTISGVCRLIEQGSLACAPFDNDEITPASRQTRRATRSADGLVRV